MESVDASGALAPCNTTQFMMILRDPNVDRCNEDADYSFKVPKELKEPMAPDFCNSVACKAVFQQLQTVALDSECILLERVRWYAELIQPIERLCGVYKIRTLEPNNSGDIAETITATSVDDVVDHTATIVEIVGGILFIAVCVIVAIVQHVRRRRKAKLAKSTDSERGDVSSDGETATMSTAQTTLTQTGVNATLWGDEDLLPFHMRVEDLQDVRLIGSGGHGVVYLVKYRQSRLLASKRLIRDHITREKTRQLVAEIKLVAKLEHPNIVQFVGAAWTTECDLQALFEYMPNGDLRTHLDKTIEQEWSDEKLQITVDIVEALVYVHSFSPPLVHRDLKSRNVLLSAEMRGKLSDFGVSRFQSENQTMTAGVGTSRWLAPEVITGSCGEYNQACDIYSFGVLLSELDTHLVPFSNLRLPSGNPMPEVAILQHVSNGDLKPTFFEMTCPSGILTLAQRCLSVNPSDRPSAVEAAYALRTSIKAMNTSLRV
ncbi:hypothetical protein P43SY_004336 [Pythium insidiosum]|uniref:Protein kinase domain-containing protein n=1 Tax=Pythium insidiosum TaxID=114742 RepID=A0AAD5Q529_PYTIN|nr:hypothetical protein P43SY_004336 [Pythium insidiosum]